MNNKNYLLVVLVLVVIGVILLVLPQKTHEGQNQSAVQTATTPSTPVQGSTVSLSLVPDKTQVAKGSVVSISVDANTTKSLLAMDLHIGYDGKLLALQSMDAGDFFESPIILAKKNDDTKGTLLFSLGSTKPSKMQGRVATFVFKTLEQQSNVKIELQQSSVAAGVGSEKVQVHVANTAAFTVY